FLLLLKRAKRVRVKIPYCRSDRTRIVRSERRAIRIFVVVWFVWALVIDVAIGTVLFVGPAWPFLLVLVIAMALIAVGDAGAGWLIRRRRKGRPREYDLPGVHPAFVAALLEDRRRD